MIVISHHCDEYVHDQRPSEEQKAHASSKKGTSTAVSSVINSVYL